MKLRFPIDKGKIQVKCACNYQFIADPDNPEIYRDAKFDLSRDKERRIKGLEAIDIIGLFNKINLKKIYIRIINILLEFKYKLQNFRLLPTSEQKKIVIIIILFVFILAIILYIFASSCNDVKDKDLII